ncbi:hypothetical protein [Lipingzhangella rawalii]
MPRRERSQTEQLRQALAEREEQLAEAHARLAAIEGSTSLRVGQALTAAARSPRRGLARLPRDLYRLWRGSGRRSSAARRGRAEPVLSYAAERQEARLLSGNAGLRDERLLVAGVLAGDLQGGIGASCGADIAPDARVLPLRPHDAQVTFDSVDADLLLVSASAAAPGGPWAHVGQPAVVDRTRVLRWVLESAAARGIPSVLLLDGPCPPGLRQLGFDQVHSGNLGVPLHRYNPVAAGPERSGGPLWVPSGVHPPARSEVLAGLDTLSEPLTGRGDLREQLRNVATAVTDDHHAALRLLACGVRVLLRTDGTVRSEDTTARLRGQLPGLSHTAATDDRELAQSVADLRSAGPLSESERRATLRELFREHASFTLLGGILRGVLPDYASRGIIAPGTRRSVTVLAHPRDDEEAHQLASDVLAQLHPPVAVAVPQAATRLPALRELHAHGVPIHGVPELPATGPTPGDGVATPGANGTAAAADTLVREPTPVDWARLAETAQTPWVAPWRGPVDTTHLVDAVCAAECSGAEAVGPALPPWRASDPEPEDTDSAQSGPDYVFTHAIRPTLARRDLMAEGTHPGVWSRHGARLLALGRCPAQAATPGAHGPS